jgi:membrane protein
LQQLTQRLGIPMHAVNAVLDALEQGGFLMRSRDDPPAYLPTRDLADVSIGELMSAIRTAGEDRFLNPEMLTLPPLAEDLLKQVERTMVSSLGNTSVKTLATEASHAALRSGSMTDVVSEDRSGRADSVLRKPDPDSGAS